MTDPRRPKPQELTEAELRAELRRLQDAKDEAYAREQAETRERVRKALTQDVIDLLWPDHMPPRYFGNACDDDTLYGHERRCHEPKEYGCQRCGAMAFARGWADSVELEIHV